MKGYEDVAAGLMLLIVVIVGGYVYLSDQLIKQKEAVQVPHKQEVKTFESLSKRTE